MHGSTYLIRIFRVPRDKLPNTNVGAIRWYSWKIYICSQEVFIDSQVDTHVEREPDLFTEDDDEPVEPSEEEEDDHKPIRHDLVTSLHRPVVLLQLLGADVDVVFASIVR